MATGEAKWTGRQVGPTYLPTYLPTSVRLRPADPDSDGGRISMVVESRKWAEKYCGDAYPSRFLPEGLALAYSTAKGLCLWLRVLFDTAGFEDAYYGTDAWTVIDHLDGLGFHLDDVWDVAGEL